MMCSSLPILCLFASLSLGSQIATANIRGASPLTTHLRRGDQVTLTIDADNETEALWFSRGQSLCKGKTCVFDSGEVPAGEYSIDVLLRSGQEVDALHFQIIVDDSPPVYKIQTIKENPRSIAENSTTHIAPNDLWVTATRGRLTRTESRGRKNTLEIGLLSPFIPEQNAVFRVPHGSVAISGSLARDDQIFMSGPNELRRIDTGIELHSGKFFWRRPSATDHKLSLTRYSFIIAKQPGETYLRTGVSGQHSAADIFAIATDVEFVCGNEVLTVPTSTRMKIVYDAKPEGCKIFSRGQNQERDDLESFYKEILKPWFGEANPDIAKFWSKEQGNGNALDKQTEMKVLVEAKQWGVLLDLLAAASGCDQSFTCLYHQGLGRLGVGLNTAAETSFREARDLQPLDPDPAFLLGKIKYQQKKYKEAILFFEEAAEHNFQDIPEAKRNSSRAAEAIGEYREAIRYSETGRLKESDQDQSLKDLKNRNRLQKLRSLSGWIEGTTEVQSHILPVDPEKFGDLPNYATTNRGLVAGLRGGWWKPFQTPKNMEAGLSGQHDFFSPFNAALQAGAHSDHQFTLGVKSLPPTSVGIDTALSFATQISGGVRQVDVFGAKLGLTGGSDLVWNTAIISNRALDPVPGGNDSVDVRINRLLDPTDHSHFDFGLVAGLTAPNLEQTWDIQMGYQNIDFRTGLLDEYDATELSLKGRYSRMISARWQGEATFKHWQRAYKQHGKDQWLGLDGRLLFTMIPLWDIFMDLGYFTRSSTDDAASYQGHHYDLGLRVML